MERKKEFIINSLYYGIILLLLLIGFLFLYKYCFLIILSYFTSLIIQPIVDHIIDFFHINHQIIKIFLSIFMTLCIYLCFILLLIMTLSIVLHVLYFLPECLHDIYNQIMQNHYIIEISQTIYQNIQSMLDSLFSKTLHVFFNMIINLTTIIGYMFFHIILTILFVLDQSIQNHLSRCQFFYAIMTSVKKSLYILLKTYFIMYIVTFLCLYIGFIIMRLENSFMIAFLISLFDFLPVLGIDMIMIPWIIICLILNEIRFAISLFIIYMITTLIRNILEPHLMSQQMKIPVLYMFMAMLIFMNIMGIKGMILSPFIVLIITQIKEYQSIKNKIKKVDFNE